MSEAEAGWEALLRPIYHQYAVDEEDGRLFELEDLMALTYPGDAHMQQFLLTWQDYPNRMATDPGPEVKRSIFHKLAKGSDALKVPLNAYGMAKRNSYKNSYDFLKAAASTHVHNKLRDNNRDAPVKANLRNTNNRGVVMLAAAGSSNEASEQVTVSAPAPAATAKAKAKAQPCFKYQKGTCDRGDRCPYMHIGEPGSTPEIAEEKKNIAEKGSKIPCNANAAGCCRFGDKCQYMHSESKTFAAGVCQDAPHDSATQFSPEHRDAADQSGHSRKPVFP